MASRLSVIEVLDTLLDDGFSNGESDDEGEEIYVYLCCIIASWRPSRLVSQWRITGMGLTLVRIELMLKTRDETVDVEEIDEANTEEMLAEAQFDETEDEMVNEYKQISISDK